MRFHVHYRSAVLVLLVAACTSRVSGNTNRDDGDLGTGADDVILNDIDNPGDPGGDAGPPPPPPPPPVTNSGSARRDGWYDDQPSLSPAVVASAGFGRRFAVTLPGAELDQIYAQPLFYSGRVLIATEANNVYSLDAATGDIEAQVALGTPWNATDIGCGDLVPTVGITATPVIDAASDTVFMLLKTYDEPSGDPMWQAHALDILTLAEKPGFPIEISGVADNDAAQSFTPKTELNRPGLLLMNGVVYAAFSSHCDSDTYNGWVVGIREDGQITAMFATETGPDVDRGSGIWQSGSGLMSDGDGRIFFIVGNSFSHAVNLPTAGSSPPPILDEAMVRLSVLPNGLLEADDFFIPANVRALDDSDQDFGSGGPVQLLDSVFGNVTYPHLAIGGGKGATLYIFDRDELGGFQQGTNMDDAVLGRVQIESGMWSRPGVWPGDGGLVYLVENAATMPAFAYAVDGNGVPALAQIGATNESFGYTSGSPVITSDGMTSGSAVVWAANATNRFGTGELRAYNPLPDANGKLALLFKDDFGNTAKFVTPGVGDGRLYIGTYDGRVIAYGAPSAPPLISVGADFGVVTVGTPVVRPVIFIATVGSTVTAITSVNTDYTVDTSALPATLTQGQTLTVNVTLTPTSAGPETASLDATTDVGSGSASLRGSAQNAAGTLSIPFRNVSFGDVIVGDTHSANVFAKNIGATAITFNTADLPAAPFTVTNLPASGSTLAPGASVVFTVVYHPTSSGDQADQVNVKSTGGDVFVSMGGHADTAGIMTITPVSLTVDIGSVAVGSSGQGAFTLQNTGGTYIVIAKSKPPITNGFSAIDSLDEGTRINPGATRTINVELAPTAPGATSATWIITATDGQGPRTITFTGTGTP